MHNERRKEIPKNLAHVLLMEVLSSFQRPWFELVIYLGVYYLSLWTLKWLCIEVFLKCHHLKGNFKPSFLKNEN